MADEIDPEILQPSYLAILRIGLENLRRYTLPENHSYLDAEIDHLHNIPSYYNETNIHRHFYYFCAEKNRYIERLSEMHTVIETGRLVARYEPHWGCIREALLPHKHLLDDHRRSQWRD